MKKLTIAAWSIPGALNVVGLIGAVEAKIHCSEPSDARLYWIPICIHSALLAIQAVGIFVVVRYRV